MIGHPDTGWFDHEVWDKGALDKDKGWNFVENDLAHQHANTTHHQSELMGHHA